MLRSLRELFTVDDAHLMPASRRDLRLDFFRGLALFFIFLDHIPSNLVSWVTIRNYGFSDAAEMFVFISGYSAAIAYGGTMRRSGFALAAARILRRCWQLYVAHIFLFVIFIAQISYVAVRFNNPMFAEEMQIVDFLNNPYLTLLQALVLRFRPANLDILPLYIVLLLAFPVILWGLERRPSVVFIVSLLIYAMAHAFHLNFPGWRPGEGWYFNPLAWQLLFVIGAMLGRLHGSPLPALPRRPWLVGLAAAYLVFSFLVVLTWYAPHYAPHMPKWLGRLIYPVSKTDLDPLRLLHFLALAYVTVALVTQSTPFLHWPISQPAVRCGQQSLYVFCFGIVLSFTAHFFLVEVNDSFPVQLAVSIAGIAMMIGLAYLITWYRRAEQGTGSRRSAGTQPIGGE